MASIDLTGVTKRYQKTPVIHGVDAAIESGEFIVILGPSGCGKSTLLRMIAGLEEISGGEIAIEGQRVNDLEPRERGCAMVFQNYALYPHMTVRQNIGYSLKVAGMAKPLREDKVQAVAKAVGLDKLLDRRPAELSGGQRQRVAMARAMVREPKVFLFDEPFSNLDAKLRVAMRAEVRSLHRSLGVTSVFVTHDQTEAMTLADRLIVMNQGIVEQIGTPSEVYHRPASLFVADFIGSPAMSLIAGYIEADGQFHHGQNGILMLPHLAPLSRLREVSIGIRPELVHRVAAHAPRAIAARVDYTEELGASRLIYATMNGSRILCNDLASDPLMSGDLVHLSFDPADLHVFDHDTGRRVETGAAQPAARKTPAYS